jgi:hypothetical protein
MCALGVAGTPAVRGLLGRCLRSGLCRELASQLVVLFVLLS